MHVLHHMLGREPVDKQLTLNLARHQSGQHCHFLEALEDTHCGAIEGLIQSTSTRHVEGDLHLLQTPLLAHLCHPCKECWLIDLNTSLYICMVSCMGWLHLHQLRQAKHMGRQACLHSRDCFTEGAGKGRRVIQSWSWETCSCWR